MSSILDLELLGIIPPARIALQVLTQAPPRATTPAGLPTVSHGLHARMVSGSSYGAQVKPVASPPLAMLAAGAAAAMLMLWMKRK